MQRVDEMGCKKRMTLPERSRLVLWLEMKTNGSRASVGHLLIQSLLEVKLSQV